MKTYIADIIPKIQRFSKKLDDLTKLTNQHWVSIGDISEAKRVFMFRANNKLLIAENGVIVDRGTWEYLGNQSLLIETSNGGYLLKHGFFDENVIALKLDSTDSYAFFVNETKYQNELSSIEDILKFLENKYLRNTFTEKQSRFTDSTKLPNYRESEPVKDWDVVKGKHYIVQIIFDNGLSQNIYIGGKTGKYFYIHSINGITYCDNKEDCVLKLYNHTARRI